MVSFLAIEVNLLIYPAFAVFLLMLIPIPLLSKYIAKLIAKLESIRIGGASLLFVIAIGGALLFSLSLKEFYDEYGGPMGKDGKPFPDASHRDYARHLSRKWRLERNMYIHGIVSILYASLLKMARLTLESHALKKKAKALDKDFAAKCSPSTPASPVASASAAAEDKKKK